jgi:formate dehydrogenase gamma subunit
MFTIGLHAGGGSNKEIRLMSQHQTTYARFSTLQRIEHAILLASFTTLSVTGLPQKYADSGWGSAMIAWMGGIESVRQIHHIAAILLMLATIYHGAAVTHKIWVQRVRLTMLPSFQDLKDGFQAMFYNVGLAKNPPQMGRYTFGEKAEYWAVIWGTVIMVITGFMLWNPIVTATLLPGQVIPAAKAAHGGEALLAILSILTWHMYNVHVKLFNKSMFTGQISRHEMEEEHPLELADIEANRVGPRATDQGMQRRQRQFIPVAVIISAVLLVTLYIFVTFEQTAITTVPRQDIQIFATPEP